MALALLLTSSLLAACGGADRTTGDDAAIGLPSFAPTPALPGMEAGVGAGPSPEVADRASDVVGERDTLGRAVVRTASIELVVDDGATAIAAVTERTLDFDGVVTSSARSRSEDGTVSGSLVLRVPADRLDEFIDALDELARSVPFRNIDEYDVTMQLSDIDAQLTNLRAFEGELRALLTEVRERDRSVEGLVAVSDRLRQVRTEIDLIEGRRIQLSDQVALSTVHVFIRQARSTAPVVGTWDLPAVVRDAIAATVRLGQLAVEGVVWFVLTVLPAVAVLAAILWTTLRLRRRRRRDADPG